MSSLTVCSGGRAGGGGGEGDGERGGPNLLVFPLAPIVDGGLEAEGLLFFFSASPTDAPSSMPELERVTEVGECSGAAGEGGADESSTTMGER